VNDTLLPLPSELNLHDLTPVNVNRIRHVSYLVTFRKLRFHTSIMFTTGHFTPRRGSVVATLKPDGHTRLSPPRMWLVE